MRRIVTVIFCTLLAFSAAAIGFQASAIVHQQKSDDAVIGNWLGEIQVPPGGLRIVFHISRGPDGGLITKLDSPDQNANGLPTTSTSFGNGTLRVDIANLKARFEGKIDKTGNIIEGTFTQGADMPLKIKRLNKDAVVKKVSHPQEPKPPFPYLSRETSYVNPAGNIKLAGTLTYPKGKGPFAAVVMITGSGPQNRDEELVGHKPFLVIADYFTRHGIAVLRVDDRGVGGSSGSTPNSTTNDFVGDVLAGVQYLKKQKEIDQKHIGVVGHSEGGVIGPMAAVRSKDVAFVVMMAGTGLNGREIIDLQSRKIALAMGVPAATLDKNAPATKKIFNIATTVKDPVEAKKQAVAYLEGLYDKLTEAQQKAVGPKPAWLNNQVGSIFNPWMLYFLMLDPRVTLRQMKTPVLAMIGSKDLQVPAPENIPEIKKALKQAGNKDATVVTLPGLNHLFQHCTKGTPNEYQNISETIAPEALDMMTKWILKHTGK
ncbi:MAG: alpha/beta fold hydrolase [Chthonomonadales bacterium]